MIVRFHVLSPPSKQRSFAARLPLLLGRGEEANFRIQHDLVSRRHCELFARDGRVFIHDLGSTNGTFLDDEPVPVSTKTAVPPGAVVRVGGLSFRVDYVDHRSAEVVPPASAAPATGADEAESGPDFEESRVAGAAEVGADDVPDFDFIAPANAETEPMHEAQDHEAQDAVGGQEIVPPEPVAAEESPAGGPAFSISLPDVEPPAGEPWAGLEAARDGAADDDSDDGPGDDKLNEFFKGLK
jgi:predicted component of type VI protein secretion system